jgi:hypothetical protein
MVSQQAGARCALHPDRLATLTCERCGNYACAACATNDVADRFCNSCEDVAGAFRYHAVPLWRLVTMSVLSSGLYQAYWMYKNWQAIKRADGSAISPLLRGFFCQFSYFMLLSDLNLYTIARGHRTERLSVLFAIGFLLWMGTNRLPDPWWIVAGGSVLFLAPAAERIWSLSNERTRARARQWSTRHTVVVVVGSIFWLFVLFSFTVEV